MGYILVGETRSFGTGYSSVYVIKTDASGNEEWSTTFGGSSSDYGHSVQQTVDGGYIIAGYTGSFGAGGYDAYLIKTDTSGNEQWSSAFGGSSSDYGRSVQQTLDGGYIMVGYTRSFGVGAEDVYLVKIDSSGNEQWSSTFGEYESDYGYAVRQTDDGGYIVAGYTWSFGAGDEDVYLVKTDASGIEEWSQTIGGTSGDYGRSVQQTDDGGYIIGGSTYSFGSGIEGDVYLVKTDASGIEEWSRTFGGESSDHGYSVQQTVDGGYVVAGATYSYGAGNYDVYLIFGEDTASIEIEPAEIRFIGEYHNESQRYYGGSGEDIGNSVQQTDDGGFVITGYTKSFGAGERDTFLLKTDISGIEQWSRVYGGSGWDEGHCVQRTDDGGYIIVGYTESFGVGEEDVYLVKTDASGNEEWSETFGGSDMDKGNAVQQTDDGGYIIVGSTGSFGGGGSNVYLVKTDSYGIGQWSRAFGGDNTESGRSVRQTLDGGYIIAGYTEWYDSGYKSDVYLIKTDALGIEQWSRTFDVNDKAKGYCVQQTDDGGYIIAGYTSSYAVGWEDVYLLKTDAQGNEQWSRIHGGRGDDFGFSVDCTIDGGYIIAGYSNSFDGGGYDVYLLKTDEYGIEEWSQTFGGTSIDKGNAVQQTADGGYIVTGYTRSFGPGGDDVYLIYYKYGYQPKPFSITNNGFGNLEIASMTLRDGDPWLGFSPAAPLTIPPGETAEITVTIDWYLTNPGINDERIIVESNVPEMSPYPGAVYVTAIRPTTDVSVSLVPDATAVPRGGELGYRVTVTSASPLPVCIEYWTNINLPNSFIYPSEGTLFGPYNLCLEPYGSQSAHLTHTVPMTAPLGIYSYNAYVGGYPMKWGENSFNIEVTPAFLHTGPEGWETTVDREFRE
jgi:hypothetical protein